jgi:hypothetical protein
MHAALGEHPERAAVRRDPLPLPAPEPVRLKESVEAVRIVEPQMLVVDGVPLAVHDRGEVVVLGDQDAVVGEQDADAAHHVGDVIDVREDVAGGDDLRLAVLGDDLPGDRLGEELR